MPHYASTKSMSTTRWTSGGPGRPERLDQRDFDAEDGVAVELGIVGVEDVRGEGPPAGAETMTWMWAAGGLAEVHEQVAVLLGRPWPSRLRGDVRQPRSGRNSGGRLGRGAALLAAAHLAWVTQAAGITLHCLVLGYRVAPLFHGHELERDPGSGARGHGIARPRRPRVRAALHWLADMPGAIAHGPATTDSPSAASAVAESPD